MKALTAPSATYRLQFNRDFTFANASKIIPYLHLLGISHIYASPFLKARAGSPHGYDIVDHTALNPEIGDETAFASYVEILRQYGMGQVLDIVPNHMGVGGDDNAWWLDVLENGEASLYAQFFDIDWHPVNRSLRNKILLPFLGDHYGVVLEKGELTVTLDTDKGSFGVRYYEHLFPIDPRTYPQILGFHIEEFYQQLKNNHEGLNDLITLIAECRALPRHTELPAARRQRRYHGAEACKRRLAELYRNHPEIRVFIDENIKQFNGTAGRRKSFDPLHRLLEAQAYRLAYWQVASDEINYRRFFDINELAGLRMENSEVFDATHGLIRKLAGESQTNGLRLDHSDGLSDPFKYYYDLHNVIAAAVDDTGQQFDGSYYLLVEKILAIHERLPADWPVAGTTGYEVAHLLNGLLVYSYSERTFSWLYRRIIGREQDFTELLYGCKKLVIRSALASELSVLANQASGIAQTDRYTRDFTYQGLRDALAEVVASFPVYRTYITQQRISDEDRRYVCWAIAQAKRRRPAADVKIFDFIQDLLTLGRFNRYSSRVQRQIIQFALRFQQYTAPVMAKAMEDTAFYIYNRLVSLNDVGFDPRTFGISINAFHHENRQRLNYWPQTMVTTSTHDSKRGEDVRARINVLSEVPEEWRHHLSRWSRVNRRKKRLVDDVRAPSRNDEYLLYQTLVGTWPLETLDRTGLNAFRQRISDYMLKAIREAKVHTSWINPNDEYENAMRHFVRALLEKPEQNAFLTDFIPFQKSIVRYGLLNSLSQTLLKLTVPGVPDIYQGSELWSFNLVDPDNRRPVDYHHRQAELQALVTAFRSGRNMPAFIEDLLGRIEDGRAKLYLIWRTLALRRQHPRVFSEGEYLNLETRGPKAEYVCSFARRFEGNEVLVAVSRWYARLAGDTGSMQSDRLPLGGPTWNETWIGAPADARTVNYRNVLTDESVQAREQDGGIWFSAAEVFKCFPVALLTHTEQHTIP